MHRQKIVIAFDPRHLSEVELRFVQSQFAAISSVLVGLPIGPSMPPRQLVPTLQAFRQQWESPSSDGVWKLPLVLHADSVADPDMLQQELAYADALIIHRHLWAQMLRLYPDYLKALGCGPVLILPDTTEAIRQVVLIYDGTHESLLALRQFVYLFPATCYEAEATVIIPFQGTCISGTPQEERSLMGLLREHFANVGLHKVCNADAHMATAVVDLTQPTLLVGSGTHLHDPVHHPNDSPLSHFWQQSAFSEIPQ